MGLCYRIFSVAMQLLVVFSLLGAILLLVVVPADIKSLDLLDSGVPANDQDHFLRIFLIKQKYPVSLGADIPITLEAQNSGKLPLSPRRMWLEFMNKQTWINIPEMEPGAIFSFEAKLPYPASGAFSKKDKFVRVVVNATFCSIAGFYVDIDTFLPGIYRRTSDFLDPELNVLVISHKASVVLDLLDSVRAFQPRKFSKLQSRPLMEESVTGTSLQPLFALQLWGTTSVEPLEKHRFYFENLIKGSWREYTLYSLDNQLMRREAFKPPPEVHVVLFVIPNEAPSDVVRGVTALWNVAEAAEKHPLLLIVNGTNPTDSAAKFSVPVCDTLCLPLNKSDHQPDTRVLQALHQVIWRGEHTLVFNSSYIEYTKVSPTVRLTCSTGLLALLLYMLFTSLQQLFKGDQRSETKVRPGKATCVTPEGELKPGPAVVVEKEIVEKDERAPETGDEEPKKLGLVSELGPKKEDDAPRTNAQGNFSCVPPESPIALTEVCNNAEDSQTNLPGGTEDEHNASIIYISIERLMEKTTLEDDNLDVTMDEDEQETETNSSIIRSLAQDFTKEPDLASDPAARNEKLGDDKPRDDESEYEDSQDEIRMEDFEELQVEGDGSRSTNEAFPSLEIVTDHGPSNNAPFLEKALVFDRPSNEAFPSLVFLEKQESTGIVLDEEIGKVESKKVEQEIVEDMNERVEKTEGNKWEEIEKIGEKKENEKSDKMVQEKIAKMEEIENTDRTEEKAEDNEVENVQEKITEKKKVVKSEEKLLEEQVEEKIPEKAKEEIIAVQDKDKEDSKEKVDGKIEGEQKEEENEEEKKGEEKEEKEIEEQLLPEQSHTLLTFHIDIIENYASSSFLTHHHISDHNDPNADVAMEEVGGFVSM